MSKYIQEEIDAKVKAKYGSRREELAEIANELSCFNLDVLIVLAKHLGSIRDPHFDYLFEE